MTPFSVIHPEGEAAPTSSPLSNGRIVRFVGRNRIEDGCLNTIVLAITCGLILPYQCIHARQSRNSWSEVFFQLFGMCSLPSFRDLLVIQPTKQPTSLRFVCISDTHMQHQKLKMPDGDVLIHSGDFTNHGSLPEICEFAAWLTTLPYKHIIIVPGNHDMILDTEYYNDYWSDWSVHKEDSVKALQALTSIENVSVLIDKGMEIKGIKLWGSPWVPQHGAWKTGFNKSSDELKEHWKDTLPDETDVLVTHTPSQGVGDREPMGHACGCPHLLEAVGKLQPKYHVMGHIHSDFGVHKYDSHEGLAINASSVTDYYYTSLRDPIVFDVLIKEATEILPFQEII